MELKNETIIIDKGVFYCCSDSLELKVDGDFSFARTASVNFSVTKSQKSLFKSAMSGEGFLNTYSGTGKVWLAPTSSIYKEFGYGFMPGNSGMDNNEID